MPVYDQGYRRWEGELRTNQPANWPITWRGIRAMAKKRKFLTFLFVAWAPVVVQGFGRFLDLRAGATLGRSGGLFGGDAGFFEDVLARQSIFVLIGLLWAGADLISSDRRAKALQLYFSRPLLLRDYVLGKLGIPGLVVAAVSVVPILLLWVFCLMIQPEWSYFTGVWWVPFSLLLWWALTMFSAGLLLMALSATADRTAFIVVSFLVLWGFGAEWVAFIVTELSGQEFWGLLHMDGNLNQVKDWIFGVHDPDDGMHPILHFLALALLSGLAIFQLRRRVRPVEVIS